MQPHLAAPVGVGVSNGRAQSLSGPNCSSDATSAICRCIVVVVVPLRATPTPQPAAAATATAAEAQRKLASLCDKSFSSSTTSRGAPTKMRPRFTKEQQQHCGRRRERRSCRRYKYNKVYVTDTRTLWKNNRIHLPYIIECINLCSGIFIECEVK